VLYKNSLRAVTFVILSLWLMISCSKRESWSAFAYPNANDLSDFRYLGQFKSLESCRAAIHAWRTDMRVVADTDYECGKNCDGVPSAGRPVICESTEK
jgi:hypothetical protein